jgi:hypothetical protein
MLRKRRPLIDDGSLFNNFSVPSCETIYGLNRV